MSTVVVGGGLAGLYTAYRLTLAGHKVTVREAAPHWGGMISPVEVDGILVDAGAEAYAVRGGLAHALCTELGLEVAGPVGTPHIWWSDGSHPMADGVLGIPGSLDDPALEVLTDTERARLADLRFANGRSTYLEVQDAQRDLFETEQALVQLSRGYLASGVALYVALGGGAGNDASFPSPPQTLKEPAR